MTANDRNSDVPATEQSRGPTRRQVFSATLGALAVGMVRLPASSLPWPKGLLGFDPLPPSASDDVTIAAGYQAKVLLAFGDPLADSGPAWHPNNTVVEQRQQAGMHHDGMHFFADVDEQGAMQSHRGSLAINHEYIDLGLLYEKGIESHSAELVAKAQAAVGVSVVRLQRDQERQWRRVEGFSVDAKTPMDIGGPARGHSLLRTPGELFSKEEHEGTATHGTLANCSSGYTPWGTYLTCEENFQDYFRRSGSDLSAGEKAYGLPNPYGIPEGWHSRYGWDLHDPRFDADREDARNHFNRFGWVVEIDPRDPSKRPVKRTALGRCRHENAALVVARDGRVVVYMGDDERFQYIYKFVSKNVWNPDDAAANWGLLDEGTLYAAKFDDTLRADGLGTGKWLPLTTANPALKERFGDDQGAIAIYAREAAKLVGATMMDRPEWIAVPRHQGIGHAVGFVYCSLSNNTKRRTEQEHPANPRANNIWGHILRWAEHADDAAGETFLWEVFLKGGNRTHP